MKRVIPLWIAVIAGFGILFSSFIPVAERAGEMFADIFSVIAAIAFILGALSLAKQHLGKLSRREAGWGYSIITFGTFIAMLFIGMSKIGIHPNTQYPQAPYSGGNDTEGSAFMWMYEYVMTPLTSTMFALLAFFVASAAFRAFRAKNTEAVLLLITAFIILLGRTFAGVLLTGWLPDWASGLRLENLSVYVMQVFNTAGSRAIMIGIALGVAATGLRILFGLDRSWLGGGDA
ncbi:MAG: hypothetical protein K8R92_06320 [Planctomycetes bacterium]|nr:hypothetical protein [Planctomycetota bacterium]